MRGERPEDWVPPEDVPVDYHNCDDINETLPISADRNDGIVDVFSAHSYHNAGMCSPVSQISFLNDRFILHH
jgi:magnesium/proton exchanger